MDELLQDARTVAIKACTFCAAGLLERDKFCRWCGARQPVQESLGLQPAPATPVQQGALSSPLRETRVIAGPARADVYRRVSGPLVTAVVSGALSTPSAENQSAFVKRMILALISIPIWLIIVLLSPLDAYAAVKNLARQV
jgi:hypothetical protein